MEHKAPVASEQPSVDYAAFVAHDRDHVRVHLVICLLSCCLLVDASVFCQRRVWSMQGCVCTGISKADCVTDAPNMITSCIYTTMIKTAADKDWKWTRPTLCPIPDVSCRCPPEILVTDPVVKTQIVATARLDLLGSGAPSAFFRSYQRRAHRHRVTWDREANLKPGTPVKVIETTDFFYWHVYNGYVSEDGRVITGYCCAAWDGPYWYKPDLRLDVSKLDQLESEEKRGYSVVVTRFVGRVRAKEDAEHAERENELVVDRARAAEAERAHVRDADRNWARKGFVCERDVQYCVDMFAPTVPIYYQTRESDDAFEDGNVNSALLQLDCGCDVKAKLNKSATRRQCTFEYHPHYIKWDIGSLEEGNAVRVVITKGSSHVMTYNATVGHGKITGYRVSCSCVYSTVPAHKYWKSGGGDRCDTDPQDHALELDIVEMEATQWQDPDLGFSCVVLRDTRMTRALEDLNHGLATKGLLGWTDDDAKETTTPTSPSQSLKRTASQCSVAADAGDKEDEDTGASALKHLKGPSADK
jgi:hypothetical protein